MKKSLFILATALCGSASAAMQVGDVVGITYTVNSATNGTVEGTFLGQSAFFNAVNPVNSASLPSGELVTTDNVASGITLSAWSNHGAPGAGACAQGFATASTGALPTTVFGSGLVTGNTYGGELMANNNGQSISMTLSGLTSGQTYSLYMLTGRGNTSWSVSSDNIKYSLSGVTDVTATLLGASSNKTGIVDGTTLSSYEYDTSASSVQWSMVRWDFVAGEDGTVKIATDANGNINAVALQMTPEPTTATLSLLALAGLCARRRRK